MKTYAELSKMSSFEDRFLYLKLGGGVGVETFGFDRYLNQMFYSSPEWRRIRDQVILRDEGCDLGMPGYEINGKIYIHHLNPITEKQILRRDEILLDPEFLICTSFRTHNAIHYGDDSILEPVFVERLPNDMIPWK